MVLRRAGYEVVFVDVAVTLIASLQTTPSYLVKAVGLHSCEEEVNTYRAVMPDE